MTDPVFQDDGQNPQNIWDPITKEDNPLEVGDSSDVIFWGSTDVFENEDMFQTVDKKKEQNGQNDQNEEGEGISQGEQFDAMASIDSSENNVSDTAFVSEGWSSDAMDTVAPLETLDPIPMEDTWKDSQETIPEITSESMSESISESTPEDASSEIVDSTSDDADTSDVVSSVEDTNTVWSENIQENMFNEETGPQENEENSFSTDIFGDDGQWKIEEVVEEPLSEDTPLEQSAPVNIQENDQEDSQELQELPQQEEQTENADEYDIAVKNEEGENVDVWKEETEAEHTDLVESVPVVDPELVSEPVSEPAENVWSVGESKEKKSEKTELQKMFYTLLFAIKDICKLKDLGNGESFDLNQWSVVYTTTLWFNEINFVKNTNTLTFQIEGSPTDRNLLVVIDGETLYSEKKDLTNNQKNTVKVQEKFKKFTLLVEETKEKLQKEQKNEKLTGVFRDF